MLRVVLYVDGFNLYHALDELNAPQLKWLDLRALGRVFVDPQVHDLVGVKYFSAYATWRADSMMRHRLYVAALEAHGVEAVMGRFKERHRRCPKCDRSYLTHEEKETDVNIGINLVGDAHHNRFDRALLCSNDSDLAPVVAQVRRDFPGKSVRILTPPGRRTSKELVAAAGDRKNVSTIKRIHVERSRLPEKTILPEGKVVAIPARYTFESAAKKPTEPWKT